MDSELSFVAHINCVVQPAQARACMLFLIFRVRSLKVFLNLFKVYVRP